MFRRLCLSILTVEVAVPPGTAGVTMAALAASCSDVYETLMECPLVQHSIAWLQMSTTAPANSLISPHAFNEKFPSLALPTTGELCPSVCDGQTPGIAAVTTYSDLLLSP